MPDRMRESLERQLERLLEEAERPMRVEEIVPHLDPIMPSPNDVADALADLTREKQVAREGSFFTKSTPVPIERLFSAPAQRAAADTVVEIVRDSGDGITLHALLDVARDQGVSMERALDVIAVLRNAGELYSGAGDRLLIAKP